MKTIFLIYFILFKSLFIYCQDTTINSTIKPKIIVIPKTPAGVTIKEFYENNLNVQIAISKINEALLKKGASIRSFTQCLKELEENGLTIGSPADIKSRIIEKSFADIYVEVKIDVVIHAERRAKSVTLSLEVYQKGTSNILYDTTYAGPMFQTDDIGRLTMITIDRISEDFLNKIQGKFDEIVKEGQSVYVEFNASNKSKHNLDSEINGKSLSSLLNNWFSEHALNNSFTSQGSSSLNYTFSDVKIPIKNPKNLNLNYNTQNLFDDISDYLKSFGVGLKREVCTNNKIIITIL